MTRWRPVLGFEDSYEVSDQGEVRCWTRGNQWGQVRLKSPVPRKLNLDKDGYNRVTLGRAGRTASVHHLVLEAFVGPRPEGLEACHKNGVRDDDRLDNLECATDFQNCAKRDGRLAEEER